jgi:hypothetical protein
MGGSRIGLILIKLAPSEYDHEQPRGWPHRDSERLGVVTTTEETKEEEREVR